MDTSKHNLETLFKQLGLPNKDRDISQFIATHRLSGDENILNAQFWTPTQAAFLIKAKDSDWTEMVDILDTLLKD